MTDPLIEQIKADAEKGAPGSWSLSDCSNFDGRATYRYYEVMDENLNVICAEVYRAHNDGGSHNMRRICRVPEMEARILADAEEKAARQWQPIETHPRQDTGECLVYSPEGIELAWWSDGQEAFFTPAGGPTWAEPTHWMPLPSPPASPGQPETDENAA